MVMTVRAMYVTVGNFFLSRIAYTFNGRFEQYFHTGQKDGCRLLRLYRQQHRLHDKLIHRRFPDHRLQTSCRLQLQQGTHLHLQCAPAQDLARRKHHRATKPLRRYRLHFAVQRFFHQRENTVITAMQVSNRLFGFIQQLVVCIVHFIMQGNYGIFNNRHHVVLNQYL